MIEEAKSSQKESTWGKEMKGKDRKHRIEGKNKRDIVDNLIFS